MIKRIVIAIMVLAVSSGLIAVIWTLLANNNKVTQSHRSYRLNLMSGSVYPASQTTTLAFDIRDENDNVLKDFDVVHEKVMHTIVVRKDLANFQHVHPNFDQSTGKYTLTGFEYPTDGEYRIFADFTPTESQIDPEGMKLPATPYQDVEVGNTSNYQPQPLGQPSGMVSVGGIDFSLTLANTSGDYGKKLIFMLMANGRMITDLQPYLGALGHSVVLKEESLDFIHAHPVQDKSIKQTGEVEFDVDFTQAGIYKVFTQFQREDKVITVPYVINVGKNESQSEMPMIDHSGH